MANKKKSMLYIVPKINFFSEGSRGRVMHAIGIAEGFVENGWKVMMVGGPGLHEFQTDLPEGIELVEITNENVYPKKLKWNVKLFFHYIKLLKNNKFDVCIVRYATLKYFLIWLFCILAKRKSAKTVLEVNSFSFHHWSNLPNFFKLIIAKIEITLANFFDVLYVVSEAMANDPKIKGCKSNIAVVPNGASSKEIHFSDMSHSENSKMRFVYLGSLQSYWDFDLVINAFSKYLGENHNAELHFYGAGAMEDHLKSVSANESRIVLHGRFKRRDLGVMLNRKTDILVLPPKLQSDMALSGGLSTKLFDYLSLRMPIIAPAMGEITAVLKHKENALLYKCNIASLIENVRLIIEDEDLRTRIANNAYLEFFEKYTWLARMSTLIDKIPELNVQ